MTATSLPPVTKSQLAAGLETIKAVADTIRELGEVPSGELYAQLMSFLTIESYNKVLGILKRVGLVKETGHLLTWAGPKLEGEQS